jgi:hypothetical protein
VLRRPKQFLEELLERLVRLMQSGADNQELELVTQSLILLLENQTALCESLPTTGYINRLVRCVFQRDITPVKVLHVLIVGKQRTKSDAKFFFKRFPNRILQEKTESSRREKIRSYDRKVLPNRQTIPYLSLLPAFRK